MSSWRYYEGQDEPLSGCELELGEFVIRIHLNKLPYGFGYFISMGSHIIAMCAEVPTRDGAQRAALDKLVSLINGWYTQAVQARAEMDAIG